MSFAVSLTDGAKSDIAAILFWIRERSPMGAVAWNRSFQAVLDDIRERADRFGASPECDDHSELIRQAIFKTRRGRPYRALFIVRGQDAFIVHVRGPGQNILSAGELQFP